MRQGFLITLLLLGLVVAAGCQTKKGRARPQYDRPLPPGQLALRKITDPNAYPDFAPGWSDLANLRPAIENSLNYLSKASSQGYYPYADISHERVVGTLEAFLTLMDSGIRDTEINGVIRSQFEVYMSVGCDDIGTVLFTGYYTPVFDGALERSERFPYPLYKMPPDLVKGADGQTLGQRDASGQVVPYPSRVRIEESGMLAGQELVWLGDRFEVYIAHVQGSAKVRLPDGRLMTVGYSASNGHDYVSVAEGLIADAKIAGDRMSLATMITYFQNHPDQVNAYVRKNPRFVFFREAEGTPHGSLNEPVTPLRTIATDKSIFPRAGLAFIVTSLPQAGDADGGKSPYSGFTLDQDTGGGIRAAGRCDVYIGEGDEAGERAGQIYEEGRLYYLFVKEP